MKSQVNVSPQRSRFRLQVLEPVLADQIDAGLGQGSHLLGRHVFGRREDLDLLTRALADSLQVGRDPARIEAVDLARHQLSTSRQTRPPWRPVRGPSRRWEKKSSGLAARAQARRLDLLHPGAIEESPGHLRQIEHSVIGDSLPERQKARKHLLAPPRSSTARSRDRSRLLWLRLDPPRARRFRRPGRASRSGGSPHLAPPPPPPGGSRRRRPGRRARRARSTCPSTCGGSGPGSANGLGSWGPS